MTDRRYRERDYPSFAVTVDIALFTLRQGNLSVLLVERGGEPFKGHWALPGGFVRPDEDANAAALRELKEETNTDAFNALEQLRSYSAPDRDPRMRVVSIAYVAIAADVPDPTGGSDAASAKFWNVADLGKRRGPVLAFDHQEILDDAVDRARSKLEYTTIATSFLDSTFTIGELRAVYETVWGVELHAPNFRRKVLSTKGFVVETSRTRQGGAGGPAAALFKAGKATMLHPPMLRPSKA